jgi:hypothetical protein
MNKEQLKKIKSKRSAIFRCSYCYKIFDTLDHLFAHEESHEKINEDLDEENCA